MADTLLIVICIIFTIFVVGLVAIGQRLAKEQNSKKKKKLNYIDYIKLQMEK